MILDEFNMSNLQDLWTLLLDRGGWTLVALAGVSVLTLATVLVSFIELLGLRPFSSYSGASGQISRYIVQQLSNGVSHESVEESATIYAKAFLRKARTGFRLLELIITAAPLLGLLGTVLGMIGAFQAMQAAGDSVNPGDLAGGIWEALITTAAGMVIAIVALTFLTLFESIADQFRFRLERVANEAFLYYQTRENKTPHEGKPEKRERQERAERQDRQETETLHEAG